MGGGGFQLGEMRNGLCEYFFSGFVTSFTDIQSSVYTPLVLFYSHNSNFLKIKLVGSCCPCLLLNPKNRGTCAWFGNPLSRLL